MGQAQTFIYMIAYLCKSIPYCGKLIAPSTELTQTKHKFLWTLKRKHAFQTLKEKLCSVPILKFSNRNWQYELETDAFYWAIGGILRMETKLGDFLPVAYKSQKLTDTEQQYDIDDKEKASIVNFVEKLWCYLEVPNSHYIYLRIINPCSISIQKCTYPCAKQGG